MKFHLAFALELKISLQRVIQGNRATPPIWLMFSIFLVRYLYESRWVSVRITPIFQVCYKLDGFLCIDNTDLVVMNNITEMAKKVVERAQKLLDQW